MAKILVIKGCLSCPYNKNIAGQSWCAFNQKYSTQGFKIKNDFLDNDFFIDSRCELNNDNIMTVSSFLDDYIEESGYGRDMSKAQKISAVKRKGVPLSDERKMQLSNSSSPVNKVAIFMLNKDKHILHSFNSVSEAARKMGIKQSGISNVLTNKAKTSGGYLWQYQQMN